MRLSLRRRGFFLRLMHVRFEVHKVVLAQVFFFPPSTTVFPQSVSLHNSAYLISSACCPYHDGKRAKPSRSNAASEIGENLMDKHFI